MPVVAQTFAEQLAATVKEIPTEEIPVLMATLSVAQTALCARLLPATNGQTRAADADALLTIDQAAARLGMKPGFLYRMKRCPFRLKVGGRLRFRSDGIDRWIENRQKQDARCAA